MSHKNYFPEHSESQIRKWLEDCPRELANVVLVQTFTILPDGKVRSLGIQSVVETSGGDALVMVTRAMNALDDFRSQLFKQEMED